MISKILVITGILIPSQKSEMRVQTLVYEEFMKDSPFSRVSHDLFFML